MHETGRGSVRDSVDNGETRDRRERRLTPTASTPVLFDTWTGTRTGALRSAPRAPRRVALDGLRDLAATQAPRAHEEVLRDAADARADPLEVRPPHALRLVVRVTHVVADRALLSADRTCARHRGPGGTMSAPTSQTGRRLSRRRGGGG